MANSIAAIKNYTKQQVLAQGREKFVRARRRLANDPLLRVRTVCHALLDMRAHNRLATLDVQHLASDSVGQGHVALGVVRDDPRGRGRALDAHKPCHAPIAPSWPSTSLVPRSTTTHNPAPRCQRRKCRLRRCWHLRPRRYTRPRQHRRPTPCRRHLSPRTSASC